MRSIGISRSQRSSAACRVIAGLALFCLLPALATGQKRSKPAQEAYAVVAGTVFQADGRLLPGAEVTIKPDPEDKPSRKPKAVVIFSDAQGEFALRVPAAPMRYAVSVKAPGFRRQEKPASIAGDERVDVFFRLEREGAGE